LPGAACFGPDGSDAGWVKTKDEPGCIWFETEKNHEAALPVMVTGEWVSGDAKGQTGFAIHGTKEPEQIGSAGSRGCIRMYNGEAILVYNTLFPLYSKVEVFE